MLSENDFSLDRFKILSHRNKLSILTLSQTKNYRLFQSLQTIFKFDENGGEFSKRVENTVNEQFLIFPQCFQKT